MHPFMFTSLQLENKESLVFFFLSFDVSYLSLSMFPGPVDQINWEDFHTQSPLNAIDHDVKAFTVPDDETGMIQFVRHLFEVQVGILRTQTISKGEPLLLPEHGFSSTSIRLTSLGIEFVICLLIFQSELIRSVKVVSQQF